MSSAFTESLSLTQDFTTGNMSRAKKTPESREEELVAMEENYKKKLEEAESKLKKAEDEQKSFKNRVAMDLDLSLKAGDTESMSSPVNDTRLEDLYHNLRVNVWPKVKKELQKHHSESIHTIVQNIFKEAVTQMDSVKKSLYRVFTENMPQKELPKKVQDHLHCSLENLQLALFHSNKQDLRCAAVMEAPENCREKLCEFYWLFCLMALNKTPLQPQWDSLRAEDPCGLPDKLTTRFTREDQNSSSDVDQQQPTLDSVFPEDSVAFVKELLERFHRLLTSEWISELSENAMETEEPSCTESAPTIILDFLQRMKQEQLAERLRNKSIIPVCSCELKSHLKETFSQVCEGVATAGSPAPWQQIDITESGATKDVSTQRPESEQPIRTVLTVGVASMGKTVLTQKFSLDWAECRANQEIQLLFPLTFRELNVLKDREFSLVGLLHHFFSQTKDLCSFEGLQLLFICDGLDECRLPLDFSRTRVLTDPTERASVEELLVNLIRGDLLPSALLWITTRPAAANQIPAECVSMVTEVRGFTEPQKEQYFMKRFTDKATAVISHINNNPSLRIMCRSPAFCWILSNFINKKQQLPTTLTNVYIHFLEENFLNKSCSEREDPRTILQTVGQMAFEQLKKGNLKFYKSDLSEFSLDDSQIDCFTQPKVKELLAALYVHQTFFSSGKNLLSPQYRFKANFYTSAVDQVLQNPHGHLDLFLLFLLGLSLPANQTLLKGLASVTGSDLTNHEAVKYIHMKLKGGVSAERSLMLLHCLNELNDRSLVEEIQKIMTQGGLSDKQMSPALWSALSFLLLSSDLEEFDLKKYCPSEDGLQKLLPVIKACSKANLSFCDLMPWSCAQLASVLSSSSSLTHLYLSNNDLQDSGVELLCEGLKSAPCRLETLSLSGCLITENGGACLASALSSQLKELDLSYNHLGASAELLTKQQASYSPFHSVRLEPTGDQFLRPGLTKYFCDLSLNQSTANRRLMLPNNHTVMYVSEDQPYPDSQYRFLSSPQVVCSPALTGRCYWEVSFHLEEKGSVSIAVTYGKMEHSDFGDNPHSLALRVTRDGYTVGYNGKSTSLPHAPPASFPAYVAVYLDYEAGCLSFYKKDNNQALKLLHTSPPTFTEPHFAGFRVEHGSLFLVKSVESPNMQ